MKRLISLLFPLVLLFSLLLPAQVSASTTLSNIKIAAFLIDWQDYSDQPITVQQAQSELFGTGNKSVRDFFRDTSYNKIDIDGTVFGYFTVPYNKSPCLDATWANYAKNEAIAQGNDLSEYQVFIYMWNIWAQAPCAYGGITNHNQIFAQGLTNNHLSGSLIAHELGHTDAIAKLGHANTRICYDSTGLEVQASDNCQDFEYQDHYDTMGNSSYSTFDAPHRSLAGWLLQENTLTVTANGTYHVNPLEIPMNGIQQLQIKIPKQGRKTFTEYCIEIRQSYGWDQWQTGPYGTAAWATGGIMIRQPFGIGTCRGSEATYLRDATPNSPNEPYNAPSYDQTLFVGKTFYDQLARVKITTVAIDSTGADVKIEYLKK